MNADRDMKRQQLRRITFFHLSPQKNQIFVYHRYFVDDEAEKSFVVGGKKITPKLIAQALHNLPKEKCKAVLLYYFFETEMTKRCSIPRITVPYRGTSSFALLKRFLEEVAFTMMGASDSFSQSF